MISSQKPTNQPSPSLIQQLINLFKIYIEGPEGCRQRSYRLLEQYPNHLTLLQIVAACDSLTGKHTEAIEAYQKCLEITPKTIAYTNNQAWNFIQLKDYQMAMTLLSDIKDKWNHPAIYSNWITVLQNIQPNHPALQDTIAKRDQFLRKYPQYRKQGNNQLIHTFLLKSQDNYTEEIQDLRTQVFQLVEVLHEIQRAPVSFQTLRERFHFLEDKIKTRKLQEQKSGFVIDPLFKIALTGLELLQSKILKNYSEKYSEQLKKYVLKSIEFINNHLFSEKIEQNFDFKSFEESKLAPTVFQIIEIGEYMEEKLHNLSKPQQINDQKQILIKEPEVIIIEDAIKVEHQYQKKENEIIEVQNQNNAKVNKLSDIEVELEHKKHQQKSVDVQQKQISDNENQRNEIDIVLQNIQASLQNNQQHQKNGALHQEEKHQVADNIEQAEPKQHEMAQEEGHSFYLRLEEVQQIERQRAQHLVQKLRVQGQSEGNPLFIVLHFRQNTKDSFIVYVNHRRINQEIRNQTNFPTLQRLFFEQQKVQLLRYYFILKNILKIYNFFGTRNFVYERKNVRSHLDCYHYVSLIAPVFNHIFADEDIFLNYKFGSICKKIHVIIVNYINQTRKKGDFLRSFNKVLKRVHEIVKSCQSPVEDLLQSILGEKDLEYSGILLNKELINIDGSTKYHEYLIQRMQKGDNKDQDEDWLIFSISILLISTLEGKDENESLEKKFLDCYYSSRITQPLRNIVLKKFYLANHEISILEKVAIKFKNIFTQILP